MRVSVKAILAYRGKFLILKPTNTSGSVNGWDGPGGTVQEGELLERALLREIKEETGIEAKNPIFLNSITTPDNSVRYEIFVCKSDTDRVVLSSEHVDYRWVNVKEFSELTGFDLTKVMKNASLSL